MPSSTMPTSTPRGLFVGLSTLDVIQLVERIPDADEKVVAADVCVAAGGPAANAAVAFAALGGHSTLVTRIGHDELGRVVAADLATHGVEVVNAAAASQVGTTVASILVTRGTGERAVVSAGDAGRAWRDDSGRAWRDDAGRAWRGDADPAAHPHLPVEGADVVVVDSYEIDLSLPIMRAAQAAGIPVVLDCGSRKVQTTAQLPYVSLAAVSENYLPAGAAWIVADLQSHRVPFGVVTAGAKPLTYWDSPTGPAGSIDVAAVEGVDSLGAGDFFHGALAYAVALLGLRPQSFQRSLRFASEVAGLSVQSFGSRAWLSELAQRRADLR